MIFRNALKKRKTCMKCCLASIIYLKFIVKSSNDVTYIIKMLIIHNSSKLKNTDQNKTSLLTKICLKIFVRNHCLT